MPFAIKLEHRILGAALYTDACAKMDENADDSSTFILHEGEIKEVSKHLVEPIELTWIDE